MGDFISREAAIVNACNGLVDFQSADYVAYDVKENLKAVPAADVVERPRWIPVTERLPEKHQWCLVVGENLYDMDFINSRGVWTIHDKPYAPIDYWMPLPEPPEGMP